MKKLILYAVLLSLGVASCQKEFLIPEGELPEWLGENIYEELKNPNQLDGTFNTYMRLIDDLGYAEVLSKTGSKTIFPANDDAFAEFFKNGNNRFGKSSYEELTKSEKAQLLYSSILDNAMLIGNLSADKNNKQGELVGHESAVTLNQSVELLKAEDMPANNPSFEKWKAQNKNIGVLYDDTKSQIVHFTGEYMLNNNMTVTGDDNDFFILTGHQYNDGDAFIFNHKVLKSNVICQNGYVNQLDGVLVNPGNMAQMLRQNSDTKYISRMMDYFAVPCSPTEKFNLDEYKNYAGAEAISDTVYAIRYLSENSQGNKSFSQRSFGAPVEKNLLVFDPGWNEFTPASSSNEHAEIAAILAPTDDVIADYFLKDGKYIVKNLGDPNLPIDREHLDEHLDAIYNSDHNVISSMLNNIMKPYLSKTVPSRFSTVQNDAFEFIGVTKDDISRENGKFNVQIANNGVIYKMNKFFSPEKYSSVLGPPSIYKDMRTMGNMLDDHQKTPGVTSTLGADMYYYLLSMKARYALFVPTDSEDSFYYIDPSSRYDPDGMKALHFIYDPEGKNIPNTYKKSTFDIYVQICSYDKDSHTFTPHPDYALASIDYGGFNSQIQDLLNYHTVVLEGQNGLGGNHYYLTKHGGAIYVPDQTGSSIGSSKVQGGAQIGDNSMTPSVVTEIFSESSPDAKITNGTVYRINAPIQPTVESVYDILEADNRYDEFKEFCSQFADKQSRYDYCGIENSDKYKIFGEGDRMSMLSTYNYTLYVPLSMQDAYDHGLPKWSDIDKIIEDWTSFGKAFKSEDEAKAYVKNSINKMHDFVLYHIQSNSVFDDITLNTSPNQTFCTNELGIAKTLRLGTMGGKTIVRDAVSGRTSWPTIVVSNQLARDVKVEEASSKEMTDINGKKFKYNKMVSSSFVVIHGIDKPLCYNEDYTY